MSSWPPQWDRITTPKSEDEAKVMLRNATLRWRQMCEALGVGRQRLSRRDFRRMFRRYERSHTPYVAAYNEVVRSRGLKDEVTPVQRVAIGKGLGPQISFSQGVSAYQKRKRSGGYRQIYKFQPDQKAVQLVYGRGLRASAELDSRQYLFEGGVVRCSEALIDSLRSNRWAWACEVDIKECFDNLDFQDVEARIPVPRLVQERVFFLSGNRQQRKVSSCVSPIMSTEDPGLPARLPQGSACASILAEIALSPYIAAAVPDGSSAEGLNYADNFLFLAQTEGEVQSCVMSLIAELRRRTRSRLRLGHVGQPKRTRDGFDFLGIRYRLTDGQVTVAANETRLELLEFEVGVYNNYVDLGLDPERDVNDLRQRANGILGSYSFVPGIAERAREVLTSLS